MKRWVTIFLLGCSLGAVAEPLDRVVAIVNEGVVTQSELNDALLTARQQLEARKVPAPPEHLLKKQVLNRLINESLQMQIAKQSGIMVDEADVDETIHKIATENHLSLTAFREALKQEGLSFDKYRETLRKEMTIARMQQQAVGRDVMVSDEQVDDYLKTAQALEKNLQRYHVQHLVIPLSEEPTPQQLRAAEAKAQELLKKIQQGAPFEQLALQESVGNFELDSADLGERQLAELPEIFAAQVVKMQPGEVKGPLRTANGLQLIRLVGVSQSNQQHHEVLKTHVRHILIKQDASTTEEQAKKRIDNLYEQLKSGKSFADLAKQYSMDPATASNGGDLGWVTPEEMVPAFAEVMTKLSEKSISHPIKTSLGWHLMEVLERKQIDDSAAYQRQQVRKLLHQRKLMEAVENWQQHVRGTSYIDVLEKELA